LDLNDHGFAIAMLNTSMLLISTKHIQ